MLVTLHFIKHSRSGATAGYWAPHSNCTAIEAFAMRYLLPAALLFANLACTAPEPQKALDDNDW
ncbi:hypothetical protein ACM26W_06355 [Halomonas sp. HK25]|uniref:hypothetical protein n=1 Tax=Halomonas sp. HK25 TaxID=3394321 RepID=UPI0039FCAB93